MSLALETETTQLNMASLFSKFLQHCIECLQGDLVKRKLSVRPSVCQTRAL